MGFYFGWRSVRAYHRQVAGGSVIAKVGDGLHMSNIWKTTYQSLGR